MIIVVYVAVMALSLTPVAIASHQQQRREKRFGVMEGFAFGPRGSYGTTRPGCRWWPFGTENESEGRHARARTYGGIPIGFMVRNIDDSYIGRHRA